MKSIVQKFFLPLLFISCLTPLFGQEYRTGAILDPVSYERTDSKPALLTRNYTNIPRSASLKQYSPIPESQGNHGTCVGWAVGFAARTISESLAMGRTNREQTSNNVFSPIYVYKNITTNDPDGQNGAVISNALDFIKNNGAVKRLPTEKNMAFQSIVISMFNNFKLFPISGYVKLFSNPRGAPGTIENRVLPVKKSIAEGKPVVIGMNTPNSFNGAKNIWRPTESPDKSYGGHAMCVVGYDDGKFGGAFEIQNSWGAKWGDGGYTWITYGDFASFVNESYEMIENLAIYKDATRFAASIKIEVFRDNKGMPVIFNNHGFYKTSGAHTAGTDFRFMMTNRHPAYVYAFSADTVTPGAQRIFPLQGVSPVLDYNDSTIAWPGERDWIRLDDVSGTDYLVVLYSKESLDIAAIENRFASEKGSFPERVAKAVGSNLIPYSQVKYDPNKMDFSAVSYNPKAVFALLLAIDHK
jgi:hypothetical protein